MTGSNSNSRPFLLSAIIFAVVLSLWFLFHRMPASSVATFNYGSAVHPVVDASAIMQSHGGHAHSASPSSSSASSPSSAPRASRPTLRAASRFTPKPDTSSDDSDSQSTSAASSSSSTSTSSASTSTEFDYSKPPATYPQSRQVSPPGPFDVKPSEIMLIVHGGINTASERLPVLHRTFLAQGLSELKFNVLYVLDGHVPLDVPHSEVLVAHHCAGMSLMNSLCCRTQYGYTHTHDKYPHVKWIVRLTDDTFCHVHNLLQYVRYFDSERPWYLGEKYERPPDHCYADGGAGWMISRATLRAVHPRIEEFKSVRGGECYDDVFYGYYMRDKMNIKLWQASGFHNELFGFDNCDEEGRCQPYPRGRVTLGNYHDFHRQHPTIVSKPITFHMRYGKQQGTSHIVSDVNEKTYFKLLHAVDWISPYLPVLSEEDIEAVRSQY